MWGWRSSLPAARPTETFAALPVSVDLSPSRGAALGSVFVAIMLVAFALIFRSNLGPLPAAADSRITLIILAIPLALFAVGAVVAGRALLGVFSRRSARFEDGHVHVTGHTVFGREEWRVPLSEFDGVGWRIVRRSGGKNSPPRIYQVIELIHPDPSRTLPLYVRQSREDARHVWERIARTLDLPAIDLREGAPVIRAAEDLDKSIRELAAEGKADAAWDPGAGPPAGISWESAGSGEGESLVVRLHARRLPPLLYAGVALGGAVLIGVGVAAAESFPIMVGLVLAGGTIWVWRREPARPRELRITRHEVAFLDPIFSASASAQRLSHDAIEEIRVVPPRTPLFGRGSLLIATDAGSIRTGQGLSAEALEWLRTYLTAAVVAA